MNRLVVVASVVAAAAGVALGSAVVGDAPPSQAAAAPAPERVGLANGPARLPLPAGWRPLGRHSSLPGLEAATEVQGPRSTVALDLRAPEHPSLLPAAVAASLGDAAPAARPERVAGYRTWRYALPGDTPAAALVVPTSQGIVTVACAPGDGGLEAALDDCREALAALQLDGAAALPPAPETAARIVLPGVVAALNKDRRAGRRRLAAVRGPAGRHAAAIGLARGYARVADRLRPLAGGAASALVVNLDALDRTHRALARAAAHRAGLAGARANRAIARRERRLGALLARVGGD